MSAPVLEPASVAAPARRRPGTVLPAWAITALLGLVYVIAAPPSTDLAAASYRSNLFERVGFTLWDNSWYGGHHLPAYSLLAPALSALLGPQLLAALAMTLATALFATLVAGHFPARASRLAAVWFAVGAAISLLSNRIPFDLGLAIGLGSLLAAQRGRPWAALGLAVLCSLASPVAGAFLALAFVTWALVGGSRRWPAGLALAALLPIGMLAFAFPEGGTQPFVASAFYPALLGVAVLGAVMPPQQRMLRVGALLYAGVLIGSYLVPTAVGGNADRLGALIAGPIAACTLLVERPRWRVWALIALAPFLLYWQVNAPLADFITGTSNPGVARSYYAPLLGELQRLGIGYAARPARIEVVPNVDHWEARWMAPAVMIARGWERQLDRYRDGVFYGEGGPLTPARYRAWLSAEGVSYVALPDAPLDYSAKAEARLIRGGRLGYLREVWRSRHWRLFAVADPTPLVQAPGRAVRATTDSLTLQVPRPGFYLVRVRFTPYWAVTSGGGCVGQGGEDWTELQAHRAGMLRLGIRFSLARVFSRGVRCD